MSLGKVEGAGTAPPCQSTEGHNFLPKLCMWRARPSSSLSNEPVLPEALLSSTLGNLLPHGGIHSLFLVLGIPPWLSRGSTWGKSTSEFCIVTTPPSFQGPVLGAARSFSKRVISSLELHKSITGAGKNSERISGALGSVGRIHK